jgi:hypothetical protein
MTASATDQENLHRGAAHAERASNGTSDAETSSGEFRPRQEVDSLFFEYISTIWMAAVSSRGGATRAEVAYTRGTGTNTGPQIKGPRCLISLPGKL